MKRKMQRVVWCVLAFLAAAVPGLSQEPVKEKEPSAAVRALEERLDALEAEEKGLQELAGELAEGKEVRSADLWKEWLPPAVYFPQETESEGVMEIADTAANITQDLLGEKDVELERLQQLKSQLEGGKEVPLEGVEAAENIGLAGREKILDEQETELNVLLDRFERLQFKDRFQRSADLDANLEGTEDRLLFENRAAQDGDTEDAASETPRAQSPVAVNLLKLGEICYRSGQIEKAHEVLNKIDSAAHAEGARIHYLIGRCRERLGDLEGALQSYEDLERLYPDSFWAGHGTFARAMVQWKLNLGPIEGAPPEVAKILNAQLGDDFDEGSLSQ